MTTSDLEKLISSLFTWHQLLIFLMSLFASNIHERGFSPEEWEKILYFEHDFSLSHGHEAQASTEVDLEKRFTHYKLLLKSIDISQELKAINNSTIKRRESRRESSKDILQLKLLGQQTHSYHLLDIDLLNVLKNYFAFLEDHTVLALPCNKWNYVDICLEGRNHSDEIMSNLKTLLATSLLERHNLFCNKIFVLEAGILGTYYRKEIKTYARHILSDDIKIRKVVPKQVLIMDSEISIDDEESVSKQVCKSCSPFEPLKPLDYEHFNLLEEWVLDVPLAVQIIFESSLNIKHLSECGENLSLLLPKLKRLYLMQDVFLHNSSRKHFGILQEVNTLELSMHSKCITSIFKIASDSGVAMSKSSAFRKLDKDVVDEILYYNTFIKGHRISLQFEGKLVEDYIPLRECITIFMLDNLVRLKHREDPNPGENRSKQINTLPISVQGIPKKCDTVRSWHNSTCHEPEGMCECKIPTLIKKEEFLSLIITLQADEKKAKEKFDSLSIWGHPDAFKQFINANLVVMNLKIDSDEEDFSMTDKSKALLVDTVLEVTTTTLQTPKENEDKFITDESAPTCKGKTLCDQSYPFNKLSPLHGNLCKMVDSIETEGIRDEIFENPEELFVNENEIYEGESLAGLIGNAVKEAYDLRNEHVEEINLFSKVQSKDHEQTSNSLEESLAMDTGGARTFSKSLPEQFGFTKYICPPLLNKRPKPARGKDDCPYKLKEILTDHLLKMGYFDELPVYKEKIIFGPDHKIGKNLLSIKRESSMFDHFLAEFPLLHVHKHKIDILFSAYSEAGLLKLLQFMVDHEKSDWKKLISAVSTVSTHLISNICCIAVSTHQIRRLATSFHLAFLVRFINSLSPKENESILRDMKHEQPCKVSEKWEQKYDAFTRKGCSINATFCLHYEMMQHLDDVVAVALAERLGGKDGYNLLLASAKSSLPFSYLNGAVAYAPFTLQLLLEHYQASPFHKEMKMALFSTPRPGGEINFSGDTKREMDHLDAVKSFHSGSTVESVIKRMSLIDVYQQVHSQFIENESPTSINHDNLGWSLTEKDYKHILPTVAVILRRGSLSLEPDIIPKNVYKQSPTPLHPIILDSVSVPNAGVYLLMKNACQLGLLNMTQDDMQYIGHEIIQDTSFLMKKIKSIKSTTIRRVKAAESMQCNKSVEQAAETRRRRAIARETKQMVRMTSRTNACQALLNEDGTKPKISKSQTISSSLLQQINAAVNKKGDSNQDQYVRRNKSFEEVLSREEVANIGTIIMEMAGEKFRTPSLTSEKAYINHITKVLKKSLSVLPHTKLLIICEEKYMFTPDMMKCLTREQRKKSTSASICHLKTKEEIVCKERFSSSEMLNSIEGKTYLSTLLAKHAPHIKINHDVKLIIDSQHKIKGCYCVEENCCLTCAKYAIPLMCSFTMKNGFEEMQELDNIKQRKGEGEMSQIDWLLHLKETLSPKESVLTIVSSGDIDAIVLQMFVLTLKWPRSSDGLFINQVYTILVKPNGAVDCYNVTKLLELFEETEKDQYIGPKIATALCIGGNDFLPKYYYCGGHQKVLNLVMGNTHFLQNLLKIKKGEQIFLNKDVYIELVKQLYSPKNKALDIDFETVRKETIFDKNGNIREAQKWMPPYTCVLKMAKITSLVIEYMQTAGSHDAELPDAESSGCYKKNINGDYTFDFGPDEFANDVDEWFMSPSGSPRKQTSHGTTKRRQSIAQKLKKKLFTGEKN